jgi:hypothetical protein
MSLANSSSNDDDPLAETLNKINEQKQKVYLRNHIIGKDKDFEDRKAVR